MSDHAVWMICKTVLALAGIYAVVVTVAVFVAARAGRKAMNDQEERVNNRRWW